MNLRIFFTRWNSFPPGTNKVFSMTEWYTERGFLGDGFKFEQIKFSPVAIIPVTAH